MNINEIVDLALEILEAGEDCVGICLNCGNEQEGVEPDAEGYRCGECGQHRVAGCEQILLMFG